MKKILLGFILSSVLILGAWSFLPKEDKGIPQDESARISVYIDPDTKIQYLLYDQDRGGGITPRLGKNGKPMIGDTK